MKTVEQLEKLTQNPFYILTEAEAKALENAKKRVSSVSEDNKKKEYYSPDNATVKETGKLNKHHGDPRVEQ